MHARTAPRTVGGNTAFFNSVWGTPEHRRTTQSALFFVLHIESAVPAIIHKQRVPMDSIVPPHDSNSNTTTTILVYGTKQSSPVPVAVSHLHTPGVRLEKKQQDRGTPRPPSNEQ